MFVDIQNPVNGKILTCNTFWLRDHCRCDSCYNKDTKQRNTDLIKTFDSKLELTSSCPLDNGRAYQCIWNDGHVSKYDFEFLASALRKPVEKIKCLPAWQCFPWNAAGARYNKSKLHVQFSSLITSDETVVKAVKALLAYGIVFIQDVPQNTTMTEMAMRRLFPIMKTFFGEMWTFTDKQDHADSAYTNNHIGPHTDNAYFCDPAGLHSLHCIEHENVEGGENFFVDGFEAGYSLKQHNLKYFEILTKTPVPFEYIEAGQHHKHSAPIIKLDAYDNIEQIRFNLYDRAVFDTVPHEDMDLFYESLAAFARITEQEHLKLTVKLIPGTYVIFDNWRVLHARNAYTGKRTMTGCYVQRTDFLSRARTLGLLE